MKEKNENKKIEILIFLILIFLEIILIGFFIFDSKKEKITNQISNSEENTSWKITQYGDKYGGQLMFYSIEGNKNGLIIIDGGYSEDEKELQYLRELINKHQNKIDSWILTHFDIDHAGAYFTILDENKDLNIGTTYIQNLPSFELLEKSTPYYGENDWKDYNNYISKGVKNEKIVNNGDIVEDIIGLKFEVLSTYNKWMDESVTNLLNNGSMVFKLYGKKESILFCSDTQDKKIGDFLIENYKEKLKSDYLQVPHHGNNDFVDEFYKIVNPELSFFPAPKWLMYNENSVSWYTADIHKKLLESLGSNLCSFGVSPITIEMY